MNYLHVLVYFMSFHFCLSNAIDLSLLTKASNRAKSHLEKCITQVQKIAQSFGNDLYGAGLDAQEIAVELKTTVEETMTPLIEEVGNVIQDPLLDLPEVLEEINEYSSALKEQIVVAAQPLEKIKESLQKRATALLNTLGLTIIK